MESCLNIFQRPDIYRLMVVSEMRKMGAIDSEIELLSDTAIMNAIINCRNPKDVAWALMQ